MNQPLPGARPLKQLRWRWLLAAMAALTVAGIAFVALGPKEQAALQPREIRGTVECLNSSVAGVYIQAEQGTSPHRSASGFPSLLPAAGNNRQATFVYTLNNGGRYEVHLGCGDVFGRWQTNNQTSLLNTDTPYVVCVDPPNAAVTTLVTECLAPSPQ